LGDAMSGARLGPRFASSEIEAWLGARGVAFRRVADDTQLCREVASRLADGQFVGWFQGRMEFGPRALGGRSILADARSTMAQRDLNLRVKGRESFRPFAPAVLWEHASEWFGIDRPSPYMTVTFPVAEQHLLPVDSEPDGFVERVLVPRSEIPACTHIDGSARVQTVHSEVDPLFHRLLTEFDALTGCPVLLNTSFNVADEPIVCTPADAYATAVQSGLDLLVLGDLLVDLR
jgi:carbamoyltransferase